jgi:acyl-coenzyme A thioesterase PaaI-like protein
LIGSSLARVAPRFLNRVKRWYGNYFAVPANTAMGIRIVDVADDSSRVVVRLKDMRGNRNAAGTVHGAAIFALAETVHGTAVLWQFSPWRHRMFTKTAYLEFLAPGRGELVVEYSLSSELLDRIGRDLAEHGRSEVPAESLVKDLQGAEVARLTATYVVLRSER